jgi:hypothetical protein
MADEQPTNNNVHQEEHPATEAQQLQDAQQQPAAEQDPAQQRVATPDAAPGAGEPVMAEGEVSHLQFKITPIRVANDRRADGATIADATADAVRGGLRRRGPAAIIAQLLRLD